MNAKEKGEGFPVTDSPKLPRRFRLWPHQWAGIPVLLAIPVLALTGFFGESAEGFRAQEHGLELSGKYPSRLRYGKPEEIELTVRNTSGQTMRDVELEFEDEFLRNFSNLSFIPDVSEPYKIRLPALKPGESRSILVSLEGESYGRHQGKIRALVEGRQLASVAVESLVFP